MELLHRKFLLPQVTSSKSQLIAFRRPLKQFKIKDKMVRTATETHMNNAAYGFTHLTFH